jgi:hypothetical protein
VAGGKQTTLPFLSFKQKEKQNITSSEDTTLPASPTKKSTTPVKRNKLHYCDIAPKTDFLKLLNLKGF